MLSQPNRDEGDAAARPRSRTWGSLVSEPSEESTEPIRVGRGSWGVSVVEESTEPIRVGRGSWGGEDQPSVDFAAKARSWGSFATEQLSDKGRTWGSLASDASSAAVPPPPRLHRSSTFGPVDQELSDPVGSQGHVKVVVRVRPCSADEQTRQEESCVRMPTRSTAAVRNPSSREEETYVLDRCFWPGAPRDSDSASQALLMKELGRGFVDAALDGGDACLLAYGPARSGKTFSVMGGPDDARGLLPRTVESLFQQLQDTSAASASDPGRSSGAFTACISYLELRNEHLYDLLSCDDDRSFTLEVRHSPQVGCWVQGAQDVPVSAWKDVEQWLDFGAQGRALRGTCLRRSARCSHCIFTLEISRAVMREDGSTAQLRSKVRFVDLAASDGAKGPLNRSLTALGRVIRQLGSAGASRTSVPFRSSKLTSLLMDAFSGARIVFLATLSPATSFEECKSTLELARAAKLVEVTPVRNESLGHTIMELEAECERLRRLVQVEQTGAYAQEFAVAKALYKKLLDSRMQTLAASPLQERRSKLLEELGLLRQGMDRANTPRLVNLCSEPSLSGRLVYLLPQGELVTIGSAKGCAVRLRGLGVRPVMVDINNLDDVQLSAAQVSGRVLINGLALPGKGTTLRHGDRLIFGQAFCFRVLVPRAKHDAEPLSFQAALAEIAPESAEEYKGCAAYAKDPICQALGRVCLLAEEANAISQEVRPAEHLHFGVEVITQGLGSGGREPQPQCAVRLLRRPRKGGIRRGKEQAEDCRTLSLLTVEEFQEQLEHMREVYHINLHGSAGSVAFDRPEQDPWLRVPPWELGNLAEDRQFAAAWKEEAERMAAAMQRAEAAELERTRDLESRVLRMLEVAAAPRPATSVATNTELRVASVATDTSTLVRPLRDSSVQTTEPYRPSVREQPAAPSRAAAPPEQPAVPARTVVLEPPAAPRRPVLPELPPLPEVLLGPADVERAREALRQQLHDTIAGLRQVSSERSDAYLGAAEPRHARECLDLHRQAFTELSEELQQAHARAARVDSGLRTEARDIRAKLHSLEADLERERMSSRAALELAEFRWEHGPGLSLRAGEANEARFLSGILEKLQDGACAHR